MKLRYIGVIGLAGLLIQMGQMPIGATSQQAESNKTAPLVEVVRTATKDFLDVAAAVAAGYGVSGGCVSGPEEGAMGVHYANGEFVGDGRLNPEQPEVLVYEFRNGRYRLVAAEFIVIASDWHSHTEAPPALMGQHLHYVGSPNRYGLPPFYELHVWAWRNNPHGTFVDWNPRVSCDQYAGQNTAR